MSKTKVGIIDCRISNIASVVNALNHIRVDFRIIETGIDLKDMSHIILPGVGTFKRGMENLKKYDFVSAIQDAVNEGKPLLGMCLGMQLLAEVGDEFGPNMGLGVIKGSVKQIELKSEGLRIPHVGWNEVTSKRASKIMDGIKDNSSFYFVHSYAYSDSSKEFVKSTTTYGKEIVAVIEQNNIYGTQFHPEKSQKNGMMILSNFTKMGVK